MWCVFLRYYDCSTTVLIKGEHEKERALGTHIEDCKKFLQFILHSSFTLYQNIVDFCIS